MKWLKKLTSSGAETKSSKYKLRTVSSYLSEKRIVFFTSGPSKPQVLGSLIGTLDLTDPSAAINAILSREEIGSTIISPGLALPHARLEGLVKIEAAVGVCPSGVHDPHDGGTPIRVFILFLGPADNMKEHLAFLSSVAALFQKEGFIDNLAKLASPQGVLHAIKQAEKSA
jgi:mannitol/fructose-specific phosphotransferase system IIA component (Ntr-type)